MEVIRIDFFIEIICVFAVGCSSGWLLEVIFRRFWSGNNTERRWVNPGFLKGPWLPVYGCGLSIMYTFCKLLFPLMPSGIIFTALGIFTLLALLIETEYLAGIISKRVLHASLWDYSEEWGNIDGIICPKFSLFWGILCAVYYFFIHSPLDRAVVSLSKSPMLLIAVGAYLGAFFIDSFFSVKSAIFTEKS